MTTDTDTQEAPVDTTEAESLTHNGRPMLWMADGYVVKPTDGGAMKSAELLQKANLDWKVQLEDFRTSSGGESGRFKAIVRQDTKHVLGIGKSRYQAFQNHELFDFLDTLVDADEALFEAAWEWHGGETVGILMRLPNEVKMGGFDRHQAYICALTNHTAGGSIKIMRFMERIACTNMVMGMSRRTASKFAITHSASTKGKISAAREALQITFNFQDEWDEIVKKLVDKPSNTTFVKTVANRVWKDDEKRLELALSNFHNSKTIPDGYRTTRYGVYNALTEVSEWLAPRTPSFERSLTGRSAAERNIILDAVLASA